MDHLGESNGESSERLPFVRKYDTKNKIVTEKLKSDNKISNSTSEDTDRRILFVAFGFGLLLLLIIIVIIMKLLKKNVEIYNKQESGYILVGKEKISKSQPNVVLDSYKKDSMNNDFEIILKKSISKKLDQKNVTITLNGKNTNYKVNYKDEDYKIVLN